MQKDIYKKKSNSFEDLFYNLINTLAYSKLCDILLDSGKKTQGEDLKTVKEFYQDFLKNEAEFSQKFGKKLHQNFVLIIDELCMKKLKEFVNIGILEKDKSIIEEKIGNFFCENNQNIESICIKYKKNVINKFQRERLSAEYVKNFIGKLETKIPRYDCIENLVEELHKENPQKFKELIDFEVGLKELKETSDKLKFVLQGREALPSGVFLLQAKESIKLKRAEKLAKKSLCIIS